MKKFIFALIASFACVGANAVDCIPSGVTDQYTYFVAVDSTDRVTFETGLSSFTVYRSRNGAAAAVFTTPTVNETDTTNMPGTYELLLDEDMTIDSGDDVQHMTLRITHAGMAPVTKEICIARPKVTAGETLTVSSGRGNADAVAISGDTNAADTLELAFDGTAQGARVFGIERFFTAASATGTTLVMDSGAAIADDAAIGMTIVACGSTQGYCQSRTVTDNTLADDTLTVDTWAVTPSGTITGYLFATAPGSGVSAPSASQVADAVWNRDATGHQTQGSFGQAIGDPAADTDSLWSLANTNLNATVSSRASQTSLDTVDDFLDTEITDIRNRLPAALVSGRMSSISEALAAGVITDAAIATDAFTSDEFAASALDEIFVRLRDGVIEDQGSITLGCLLAAAGATLTGDFTTAAGTTTFEEHTGTETRVVSIQNASSRTVTITCPTY